MRIFFTSDTHGAVYLSRFSSPVWKSIGADSNDLLIHCGDLSAPFPGEESVMAFWANFPCPVLLCLGNHENYPWIHARPKEVRFGARGYTLLPNLFAPCLGEYATIADRRFWFFPGGYSARFLQHAANGRVFPDEMPTQKEAQTAIDRFLAGDPVDFLISHDGPRSFIQSALGLTLQPPAPAYETYLGLASGERIHPAFALDPLYRADTYYRYWIFGHHHIDLHTRKWHCLFHDLGIYYPESDFLHFLRLAS